LKKILSVCVILLFSASLALAKFDPAFTWKTLETPHFEIHYHQGEDDIAGRTAIIAEDVHDRLVPLIKWNPKGRTHIVLVDASDESNGFSTPFPYNRITLFITRPVGQPGFGTIEYDEWLRLLITHEYTHTLHLDMVNGVPSVLQDIFGRLYFPNLFESLWIIEGLATYEETEQTSGGRGRSPGSEMIIRTAVLEDNFPSLGQATVFPDFWPSGEVPYLFGEGFTRFIAEKYGKDKLTEIYTNYSRYVLPFFVDANGEQTLGKWYSDLWKEWLSELRGRYARVREDLAAKGLTSSLPLTKRGFINVAPALSPDGRRIAYTVSNADEFPGIYLMNADGTEDHKLVENTFSSTASGESIAWSPDGRGIFYTKEEINRNTNLYNDIYFYDLKKGAEIRVTRGLRARDPYPSPDGKKLVFVINKLGKTRIALAEIPGKEGEQIGEKDIIWLTRESDLLYETPRFSPDGTRIAVSVWQPGGYTDIWILDNRGVKVEELMHDRANDGSASWSADGRFIYFSSDRTGIFNLYSYELATKKIYQITNVLGGAFSPVPSLDGRTLLFASYSSHGYDIHQLPMNATSWKTAEPYQDRYPAVTYSDKPVETKSSSYNPLPTLLPRFWIPWYGYSEASGDLFGFLTYGQDAVEHHTYALNALYSPTTHRKWYSFGYAYNGLYPTIQFAAADLDDTYSGLLTDLTGSGGDYVQRDKTVDVSIVYPFLKIRNQHTVTVGYQQKEISALTNLQPGPQPAQGTLASGRISYLYNSAQQYGFSISPENGRTIELGYERFDKSIGSDFNITKYTADWHEYLNLPWQHHVLQVRAFFGTSQGDVIPQGAFQLGGDDPGNTTIDVEDLTVYLRGYPVNAFRGQKAGLASLEYRFPIRYIETAWSNAPVFLRRLHGAIFAEAGNAWNHEFRSQDLKRSFGAELRLDTDIIYYVPITFRIVIAKGLDEEGESTVYLALWLPALY
jgi:Tol biopolymer transport system component